MADLITLASKGASLLNKKSAATSIQDHLEKSIPGFGFLQTFFKTWLKVDITTLFVAVSLVGAASRGFTSLKDVASSVYWGLVRALTASISVAGSDRLNREVLNWLGANVLGKRGSRILTAHSETIQNDSWHYRRVQERNDYYHEKRAPVQYLPTFGVTWFFHRYHLFMVRRVLTSRSRYHSAWGARNLPEEYAGAPDGDEPLVIMCLGPSVDPIKTFLQTCRDFADKQREAFITVRAHKGYHNETWDTTILRPIRPLETVHFDEKIKAELVADIRNYLDVATRKFYTERGIPYRRGYLLHGPPGTGKTSLSLALAGYFGLELFLMHIPSLREDAMLERLFTALPPRCIVLLEDIDAVGIKSRTSASKDDEGEEDDDEEDESEKEAERKEKYGTCRVTLSGLLNVLDGVASQEGRIVCMTSNFAEKLDHALTRPGRVDKVLFLGNVSKESAEHMFFRMFLPHPDGNTAAAAAAAGAEPKAQVPKERLEELAREFSGLLPEDTFTPAQLQGFLLDHREDPELATRDLPRWILDEMQRMEEVKARAKRAADIRRKKRREARLRALAKLKKDEAALQKEDEEKSKKAAATPAVAGQSETTAEKAPVADTCEEKEEEKAPEHLTNGTTGEAAVENTAPAERAEPAGADQSGTSSGEKVALKGSEA